MWLVNQTEALGRVRKTKLASCFLCSFSTVLPFCFYGSLEVTQAAVHHKQNSLLPPSHQLSTASATPPLSIQTIANKSTQMLAAANVRLCHLCLVMPPHTLPACSHQPLLCTPQTRLASGVVRGMTLSAHPFLRSARLHTSPSHNSWPTGIMGPIRMTHPIRELVLHSRIQMTVEVKCFHKLVTMKTKPAVSFCQGCHEENEHVKRYFSSSDLGFFIFALNVLF